MRLRTSSAACVVIAVCTVALMSSRLSPPTSAAAVYGATVIPRADLLRLRAGDGTCDFINGNETSSGCLNTGAITCPGVLPPCSTPTGGCTTGCTAVPIWLYIGPDDPDMFGRAITSPCSTAAAPSFLVMRQCAWLGTCKCNGLPLVTTLCPSSYQEAVFCDSVG